MNAQPRHIRPDDPTNVEAEQQLLGAVMHNNDVLADVAGFLEARHFSEPVHAEIYRIMGEMLQAGRPVTPVTIADFLPDMKVGELPLIRYVVNLFGETVGPIGAPGFARAIHENAIKRELREIADGISGWARKARPGESPAVQIADAEARLFNLAAEAARGERGADDDGYDGLLGRIAERRDSGGRLAGAPTGIATIDRFLGGFEPGDLALIAGRPGMGKTALATSIARSAARSGTGVGFDSIEMTRDQIRYRLLTDECEAHGVQIAYANIRKGRINEEEFASLRAAAARLGRLPLHIITAGNRLADIPGHIRTARKAVEKKGGTLKMFIVDYLQLLKASDRYAGQRVNEVGEISSALKDMARKEEVAILALSQLSRAVEGRDDKRPGKSDLRDSGNLEQDADIVMFCYREHYYLDKDTHRIPKPDGPDDQRSDDQRRFDALDRLKNEMEVIVDKQRQGPTGTLKLWCDMATNAVRDKA